MKLLTERGICCSRPVPCSDLNDPSTSIGTIELRQGGQSVTHFAQLLCYIEGDTMRKTTLVRATSHCSIAATTRTTH